MIIKLSRKEEKGQRVEFKCMGNKRDKRKRKEEKKVAVKGERKKKKKEENHLVDSNTKIVR